MYPGLTGMLGLGGLRVVEDPTQLQIVEHKQERKWARRKMWQPARRFDVIRTLKPSRTIMQMGDMLIMHPEMANEVREEIEKQNAPRSMGMQWQPDIQIRPNRDIINLKG